MLFDPRPVEVPSLAERPLDVSGLLTTGGVGLVALVVTVWFLFFSPVRGLVSRIFGVAGVFFCACAATHFLRAASIELFRPRYEPFPQDAFLLMVSVGVGAALVYGARAAATARASRDP